MLVVEVETLFTEIGEKISMPIDSLIELFGVECRKLRVVAVAAAAVVVVVVVVDGRVVKGTCGI